MVQLMPLPPRHLLLQQNPEWFILLVPAYPGCPGKKAVKRLCDCVCVFCCNLMSSAVFYVQNDAVLAEVDEIQSHMEPVVNDAVHAEVDEIWSDMEPVVVLEILDLAR